MTANWNAQWREQILPTLADDTWDLIVIGGGISGAGIVREAARRAGVVCCWSSAILPGAPPADHRKWSTAVCGTSPRVSGA